MPYISQTLRPKYSALLNEASNVLEGISEGELNYIISNIVGEYLIKNGVSYGNINKVIGVLECTKLELYSRVAVDYELIKIHENGDIEPYSDITNLN